MKQLMSEPRFVMLPDDYKKELHLELAGLLVEVQFSALPCTAAPPGTRVRVCVPHLA